MQRQILKIAYLTWQIFFQKSRSFLIVISESHRILVDPTALFLWVYNSNPKKSDINLLLSKPTSNWIYLYALFNKHCWCLRPMCVKSQSCCSPERHWCRRVCRILSQSSLCSFNSCCLSVRYISVGTIASVKLFFRTVLLTRTGHNIWRNFTVIIFPKNIVQAIIFLFLVNTFLSPSERRPSFNVEISW